MVAATSRPGDDETLIEDLGAVEGQQLGPAGARSPRRSASPMPDPEPRRRRPQDVAGGEEAPLVEEAVGRQEQLAVDVPDLAVLEQRRGDEQPVVGRLLDERDDGRQPARRRGQRREARIVEAHRDLGGEVLEQVAGQAELGEDDEVGAVGACLAEQLGVPGEVGVEGAELRRDLGEGDAERLHAPSLARRRQAPGGSGRSAAGAAGRMAPRAARPARAAHRGRGARAAGRAAVACARRPPGPARPTRRPPRRSGRRPRGRSTSARSAGSSRATALRVAEPLAQPAAGVEAAAGRRVDRATARRP